VTDSAAAPAERQIDSVVFDLGGVLLDWNPRHLYRSIFRDDAATMERFLATVCTPAWNVELDRGHSFEAAVESLQQQFPEHHDHIAAYRARWIDMIGGTIDGTVEILELLAARDIALYALSNIPREGFDHASRKFPFFAHFRGALVSGDEGIIKPDPAIFRLLAQRFGLDPKRTLLIDDVPANAEGARSVRFHAHAFTTAQRLRDALAMLGVAL
jgi:2-haloacid dehalogenase